MCLGAATNLTDADANWTDAVISMTNTAVMTDIERDNETALQRSSDRSPCGREWSRNSKSNDNRGDAIRRFHFLREMEFITMDQ